MSIGQKLLPQNSKRSSVGRSEFWSGGANNRQSIDHVPSERQVFSAFSLSLTFFFWQVKDRLFIYRVLKCFGSFSLNELRHELRVKPSMCHTKYVSNKMCETKY